MSSINYDVFMNPERRRVAQVVLLMALICALGVGIFYVWQRNEVRSDGPNTATSSIKVLSEAIINRAGWKTYHNALYGFSFEYPPTATLSESKVGLIDGERFNIADDALGFSLSVRNKKGLAIGGANSTGTAYSESLDRWFGDIADELSRMRCDFTALGQDTLPAMTDGGGDAGYSSSIFAVLTDRDYAILLTRHYGGEDSDEKLREEELAGIGQSLKFTEGLHPRQSSCAPLTNATIPSVVAPAKGAEVVYPNPLTIAFSSSLPPTVGTQVFLQQATEARYLNDISSGSGGTFSLIEPYGLGLAAISPFKKDGAYELLMKFYTQVRGSEIGPEQQTSIKVYLGTAYDVRVPIQIKNTSPYSFEASILSDPKGRWFVDDKGVIVLVNQDTQSIGDGVFFENIVDVKASNVYGCYIRSPWRFDPSTNLENVDGHYAYGVYMQNISDTFIGHSEFEQDFGCYAPDGTLLHKVFKYRLK
jgi:hypothetical protein